MRGYIFVSIPQITFKHGNFLILKHSSQLCWWFFTNLSLSKVEKKREGYNELRSNCQMHERCLEGGWGGEGGNAYKALMFLPFHSSLNPQIWAVCETSMCHIMSNQNIQFLHRKITHMIPCIIFHASLDSNNFKLQCCQ